MKTKKAKALDVRKAIKVVVPKREVDFRFVIPAAMKAGVLQAITDIRELFGPKGENWVQGDEHEHYDVGELHPDTGKELRKELDRFCLIGGVYEVDGRYEQYAQVALSMAIAERTGELDDALAEAAADDDESAVENLLTDTSTITTYNDITSINFADILAVIKRAKAIVKSAPTE